eukprot:scaffold13242_cov15-Prasinocladus_malaysianus.AAC.1
MFEGMDLVCKKGNKSVDLGWASNNSYTLHSIVLDPREPPDDGNGPACELKYLPVALVVRPKGLNAADLGHISDKQDLAKACLP